MNHLVILDNGHGIEPITNGKRTPIFDDGSVLYENEFNRDVVMLVYNKLQLIPSINAVFTAPEKYDVPLTSRIIRANNYMKEHQDFFGKENSKCILISIHANAYGDGKTFNNAKGVETYCCSTPSEERKLAETIHKHLKGGTTQIDRGVQEICFAILKGNMTSCLVECAFMTNLEEANLLRLDSFKEECANEIVEGIKEYFGLGVQEIKADFKRYKDGTLELKGNPLDINCKIVNKSNRSIQEPNCVNGTFFWYEDDKKTKTYPTSILIINGKILRNEANHYPCPQSIFIVYKNGKVDMKRVTFATELDYKNIKVAVGGVGLRNTLDKSFKYSPVTEGFKGRYADVLATRNKTVIGYNIVNKKVYLLTRKNISHGSLLNLVSDNSTGEAYDLAISLDGGGSTFMNNSDDIIMYGDGRLINNIIGFFSIDPRIEFNL